MSNGDGGHATAFHDSGWASAAARVGDVRRLAVMLHPRSSSPRGSSGSALLVEAIVEDYLH